MSIYEAVLPGSVLVPPVAVDDFVGELRRESGLLLGAVDWFGEQLLGFSILAETVFKPFGGDWLALQRCEHAWHNAADACDLVAANFDAIPRALPEVWTGQAADALLTRVDDLVAHFKSFGEGCKSLADVTGALIELCRAACSTIALALSIIGDRLTIMLVEAMIPVIGWIGAAVTAIVSIEPVISAVNKIYRLIDRISSAIETTILVFNSIDLMARTIRTVLHACENLLNFQTATAGEDAARAAFGVAR